MRKIRKNDEVVVITGRDKKRRGQVLSFHKGGRILVENVNLGKKSVRPNPKVGESGGIIEKEMPIHISNVMLYDPSSKKAGRVGLKEVEGRGRVRYFKNSGELVN